MVIRKGESERVWFRANRCFSVGPEWYFATREGKDIGPFKSRQDAVASIPRYLKGISVRKDAAGFAGQMATQGVWAANNYI